MTDAGIKKYKQAYKDLPPINSITQGYSVRYRIISEDRNRYSHWSPVYLLVPGYTYVPGSKEFNSANQVASITWDPVAVTKSKETYSDVVSAVRLNNIVTVTTSDAHYMNVNDWVTIYSTPFNGTYKIQAVTTNTFSYYQSGSNVPIVTFTPYSNRSTVSFIDNAYEYDIWLRWGRVVGGNMTGDWIYKERVSTTSVSYPHAAFYTVNGVVQASPPNRLSVEIYLVGSPVARANFLKVYEIPQETI